MDREGGTGLQVDDVPCTASEFGWGGVGGSNAAHQQEECAELCQVNGEMLPSVCRCLFTDCWCTTSDGC